MLKQQLYVCVVGSLASGLVMMVMTNSLHNALLGAFGTFVAAGMLLGLERVIDLPTDTGRHTRGPKQ